MLRILRIILPGLLFALVAVQYSQLERLKAENQRLKAKLIPTRGIEEPFAQAARAEAAGGRAPEAYGQASPRAGSKTVHAKRPKADSKKDLERFLDMPRAPARPRASAQRLYPISNCRQLEVDSNKYAGRRISITDIVEKMDNFYDFARCSGIRVSFDQLDDADQAALKSKFRAKSSASLTMSGEYSGIELAVDKVR